MQIWRGPFGLRGRIVGAVLVTTVVTLVVAAVALLGPIEHDLRKAEFLTFQSQVSHSLVGEFVRKQPPMDPTLLADYGLSVPAASSNMPQDEKAELATEQAEKDAATAQHATLQAMEKELAVKPGASQVELIELPAAPGYPNTLAARWPPESALPGASQADVDAALKTHSAYQTYSVDGSGYARAVLTFTTRPRGQPPTQWALVISRQLVAVSEAGNAVRVAFFDAALAALAVTLLFAIPLSFTLVRRLRSLREAAREVARHGPGGAKIPDDRARDEVGDLARTFALMQQQLLSQEEARRAFVATASHELRTPLTSLEGMLELLEDGLGDQHPDLEDARALVVRARVQSHRLGRLAADLLDLSRIDAQVALRSEPVELGELSRAVLAEFDLGTTARGVSAELQEAGGPLWALGDPGSVARILRILLDNALRVAPVGSRIVVTLGRAGGRAMLSVGDEGPGVPEAEREQIFARFHRGPETSGQAGFGLGLAIGRELAERMGGALTLERTDGAGATFTLGLPVSAAPDRDPLALA